MNEKTFAMKWLWFMDAESIRKYFARNFTVSFFARTLCRPLTWKLSLCARAFRENEKREKMSKKEIVPEKRAQMN